MLKTVFRCIADDVKASLESHRSVISVKPRPLIPVEVLLSLSIGYNRVWYLHERLADGMDCLFNTIITYTMSLKTRSSPMAALQQNECVQCYHQNQRLGKKNTTEFHKTGLRQSDDSRYMLCSCRRKSKNLKFPMALDTLRKSP